MHVKTYFDDINLRTQSKFPFGAVLFMKMKDISTKITLALEVRPSYNLPD